MGWFSKADKQNAHAPPFHSGKDEFTILEVFAYYLPDSKEVCVFTWF